MNAPKPRYTNREQARAILTANANASEPQFSTIDPKYLRDFAANALRWIDCAPDGANHRVAPMQDKRGVPMGTTWNENVGPCKALRAARAARGLEPFSGLKGAKPVITESFTDAYGTNVTLRTRHSHVQLLLTYADGSEPTSYGFTAFDFQRFVKQVLRVDEQVSALLKGAKP